MLRTTTRRLLHSASFDLTWRDIDEWDENVEAVRWAIELAAEEVPSIDMPGLFYQDSVQTRSIPNQTQSCGSSIRGNLHTLLSFFRAGCVFETTQRITLADGTYLHCRACGCTTHPVPSHAMPCHAMHQQRSSSRVAGSAVGSTRQDGSTRV